MGNGDSRDNGNGNGERGGTVQWIRMFRFSHRPRPTTKFNPHLLPMLAILSSPVPAFLIPIVSTASPHFHPQYGHCFLLYCSKIYFQRTYCFPCTPARTQQTIEQSSLNTSLTRCNTLDSKEKRRVFILSFCRFVFVEIEKTRSLCSVHTRLTHTTTSVADPRGGRC